MSDPAQRGASGGPGQTGAQRIPDEPAPGPGHVGGWRARTYAGAGQPEWRAWTWSSTTRPVPWLGVLVLLLGVGLLIEQLIPELSLGSLIILALGGAFAVAWLFGRFVGATVPALVLIAWALARMGGELGYLTGEGWSLLFLGIALLLGWALGRTQRVRREWALWLGLILGLIGLADASDRLPFTLDAAVVIPLALIGLGLLLIWRRRPIVD